MKNKITKGSICFIEEEDISGNPIWKVTTPKESIFDSGKSILDLCAAALFSNEEVIIAGEFYGTYKVYLSGTEDYSDAYGIVNIKTKKDLAEFSLRISGIDKDIYPLDLYFLTFKGDEIHAGKIKRKN